MLEERCSPTDKFGGAIASPAPPAPPPLYYGDCFRTPEQLHLWGELAKEETHIFETQVVVFDLSFEKTSHLFCELFVVSYNNIPICVACKCSLHVATIKQHPVKGRTLLAEYISTEPIVTTDHKSSFESITWPNRKFFHMCTTDAQLLEKYCRAYVALVSHPHFLKLC